MTTKKRAKPEHLQKLTALFEQYPDGLNMRQIQTELQTSAVNAQAALDELGAVKDGAKWVLVDDEPAQVAPGAKADTAEIEPLQNLHELPTTEETQLVGNPDQLHIMSLDTSDVDALRKIYERSAPQVIIGSEPKQIGQSVFDGLPSEIMWAAVDSHGTCLGFRKPPIISAGCYKQNVRVGDVENPIFIGWPFDNTNWMDSIIQRESFIDQLGIENFQKECVHTSTENPVDQPKQLDQSVFNGLPSQYRWAAVDAEGDAFAFDRHPPFIRDGMWLAEVGYRRLGHGFDATNWGASLIERKCPVCKVATDVAPLGDGECQMCYEDASDKAWWDEVSDYSLIFENIMARVLSTIKNHGGATADRLHELTGMHPDDIEDAVQYMVDHKQLVSRPLYFTTVYEVAA